MCFDGSTAADTAVGATENNTAKKEFKKLAVREEDTLH